MLRWFKIYTVDVLYNDFLKSVIFGDFWCKSGIVPSLPVPDCTLGLQSLVTKNQEIKATGFSDKSETLLFPIFLFIFLFDWGPQQVDSLLSMPCLSNRPTESYSAADRNIKCPSGSCLSIDFTGWN